MAPQSRAGKILLILFFCCMAPLTAFLGLEALQHHQTGKAMLELAASAGWLALAVGSAFKLSKLTRETEGPGKARD